VLSRLEGEGLLESRHGVGTFVTDVDIDSLAQVFQLRMELAELLGKLDPIPRGEADLARVRALLVRCDKLLKKPDPKAYARLNMDFFQELGAMVGNAPLREISERLYYLTTRIWLKSVPHLNLPDEIEVFRREMADILQAMEVGDLEAVGHIRRSHISMSVKRMKRYPDGKK
jgi:DNA-binding GntR family transcriptional regulator